MPQPEVAYDKMQESVAANLKRNEHLKSLTLVGQHSPFVFLEHELTLVLQEKVNFIKFIDWLPPNLEHLSFGTTHVVGFFTNFFRGTRLTRFPVVLKNCRRRFAIHFRR